MPYERYPIPASALFKRVCGLSKGKWCVLDLWLCHDAKHFKLSSQSWAGPNPAVSQPSVTARPSFHFWLHHELTLQRRYMRALFTFAFSWTVEASWCDVSTWTLVQHEPPFCFSLCMWDYQWHHWTEPWWAHTHFTPRWRHIHVFVQLSLGGENRTCLQCLTFPNRPLNYFRDAIFKAYNNSWILMLPEIYIYIFDCIFNETFWATICKKKKTSKKTNKTKKRLRKAAWLWSVRQGSGALLWNESGTSTVSPASSILSLRLQLIWMYLSRPVCFKLFFFNKSCFERRRVSEVLYLFLNYVEMLYMCFIGLQSNSIIIFEHLKMNLSHYRT